MSMIINNLSASYATAACLLGLLISNAVLPSKGDPLTSVTKEKPFTLGSSIAMGGKLITLDKGCVYIAVYLHSEEFEGLERIVLAGDVVRYRKQGTTVEQYPNEISALVFAYPYSCRRSRVFRVSEGAGRDFLESLRFEAARKHTLQMYPLKVIEVSEWQKGKTLRKDAAVNIGEVVGKLSLEPEDFGCRVRIKSEGVPLTEALVVTITSGTDGWLARFSARL